MGLGLRSGVDAATPLPGTEGSRRGCGAAAGVECEEEARLRIERHVTATAAVAAAALHEQHSVRRRLVRPMDLYTHVLSMHMHMHMQLWLKPRLVVAAVQAACGCLRRGM